MVMSDVKSRFYVTKPKVSGKSHGNQYVYEIFSKYDKEKKRTVTLKKKYLGVFQGYDSEGKPEYIKPRASQNTKLEKIDHLCSFGYLEYLADRLRVRETFNLSQEDLRIVLGNLNYIIFDRGHCYRVSADRPYLHGNLLYRKFCINEKYLHVLFDPITAIVRYVDYNSNSSSPYSRNCEIDFKKKYSVDSVLGKDKKIYVVKTSGGEGKSIGDSFYKLINNSDLIHIKSTFLYQFVRLLNFINTDKIINIVKGRDSLTLSILFYMNSFFHNTVDHVDDYLVIRQDRKNIQNIHTVQFQGQKPFCFEKEKLEELMPRVIPHNP